MPSSKGVTLKRVKTKILFVPILAISLASTVAAQDAKVFLGRWDLTVTPAGGEPYPQWMELTDNGGKIEGRVQPRGGAWHPIEGATIESGKLIVTVGESRSGSPVTWELAPSSPGSSSQATLTGTERGDGGDLARSANTEEVDQAGVSLRWQRSEGLDADRECGEQ
jgi:hypothetical protein